MDKCKVLVVLEKDKLLNELPPAFYLKRPQIVGAISRYGDQLINEPQFRYAKIPKAYPLDLNKGFEQHRFYDGYNIKNWFLLILRYALENETEVFGDGRTSTEQSALIITQRGSLDRVMRMPYRLKASAYNDVTLYAIKYNNVIYLSRAFDNDTLKTKNDSYHAKFEQYCSAESPEAEPNTDEAVDENFRNYCIFRTKLKDFNILYSGEMKLIRSDQKLKDFSNLDELNKTCFAFTKLINDYPNFNLAMHPKPLDWWISSYLSNVDDVFFGRKQSNGYIHLPVEHIRVRDLPKSATWKPHLTIRFLHQFLTMVQGVMSLVNCPYTVYEFIYDSKSQCIKYKIHGGKTELSFLPDEFIERQRNRTI